MEAGSVLALEDGMSKKLTPWFKVKERPARPGLYQVAYDGVPHRPPAYRLWTGDRWRSEHGSTTLFGVASRDAWRGLAEQPKEK